MAASCYTGIVTADIATWERWLSSDVIHGEKEEQQLPTERLSFFLFFFFFVNPVDGDLLRCGAVRQVGFSEGMIVRQLIESINRCRATQHPAILAEAHLLRCFRGLVPHVLEAETERELVLVDVYSERDSCTWIVWTSRCLTFAIVDHFRWSTMIGEEGVCLTGDS